MKTPNILKIILPLIILVSSFTGVYALDIKTRESLGLDNTLIETESITYSQPTKIYIAQVQGFQDKLSNNPQSWIKLLYYYSITQLKLSDIPYNYLLTEGGEIYEGKTGGVGANPGLISGENVILVGYMSNKGSLTPRATTSLTTFIEQLSYEYGIKDASLDTVNLKIVKSEDSVSVLKYESIKNTISTSIADISSKIKWSNEEHLEYKASISSVEYPKESVIGEKLNVKVTIKNENDFTWFGDSNYIYVSVKDNKESIFAINGVWDSFSKPTHIEKGFVKPGEEVTLTFDLLSKSKPGEYTESFVISKSDSLIFKDSSFDVSFKITPGDYKLVQIYSPEYGFVNIRECRFYSCKKLDVANDGEVYIVLKEEEGWYQIEYGEGSNGWVYQRYIKSL